MAFHSPSKGSYRLRFHPGFNSIGMMSGKDVEQLLRLRHDRV